MELFVHLNSYPMFNKIQIHDYTSNFCFMTSYSLSIHFQNLQFHEEIKKKIERIFFNLKESLLMSGYRNSFHNAHFISFVLKMDYPCTPHLIKNSEI